MTVSQVSLIFGLLSLATVAGSLVVVALLLAGRVRELGAVRDLFLPLAFSIALVCTLGSLYYSGIVHFRPCRLCWWQRISMYPLVPVLAVGLLRRDRAVAFYALPLALMGLGWAVYHTQLRWFPEQGSSCEAEAACTSVWVNTFGFISIPFMAAAGFLAITTLLVASIRIDATEGKNSSSSIEAISGSNPELEAIS